jgi:hypothetical protein
MQGLPTAQGFIVQAAQSRDRLEQQPNRFPQERSAPQIGHHSIFARGSSNRTFLTSMFSLSFFLSQKLLKLLQDLSSGTFVNSLLYYLTTTPA